MPPRSIALLLTLAAASACDAPESPPPAASTSEEPADLPSSYLVPVPYPDLSRNEAELVQKVEQWQQRLRELTAARIADEDRETVVEGYGVLGKTFHSFGMWRAAFACYENAARLDPKEIAWPYLHGCAHQSAGNIDAAVRLFERALELSPTNVPALVRLARCERLRNQPARAEQILRRALERDPHCGAAQFDLAKLLAAKSSYDDARTYFERALGNLPHASEIHYPLAMTLRELGKVKEAKGHLARRGERRATLADPILASLAVERTGVRPFLVRGTKLMNENRLEEARVELRKAVTTSPDDAGARLNLGLTLLLLGLPKDAETQLVEALRLDPRNAKAHINLGVILAQRGDDEAAVGHFRVAASAKSPPIEALLNLGHGLRRIGEHEAALQPFEKALTRDPTNADALMSLAYTRMRLGRWKEARAGLELACRARSDDLEPAHALARILASAPDDAVRDGARALTLARTVVRSQGRNRLEHGATLAMALAEVGRFDDSVKLVEAMLTEVAHTGQEELGKRLQKHIESYRKGQGCRTPWPPTHPILSPPTLSPTTSAVTPR